MQLKFAIDTKMQLTSFDAGVDGLDVFVGIIAGVRGGDLF